MPATIAKDRPRTVFATVPIQLSEIEDEFPSVWNNRFEVADYVTDTTTVIDCDDLSRNTRYGYVVYGLIENRVIFGHNRLRSFRTLPREEEQRSFQLDLFSSNMPHAVNDLFEKRTEVTNVDTWDFLDETLMRHADDVDLAISCGDHSYVDGALFLDEESMYSWYRDIYRSYWGFETVQRAFDGLPMYMTWDDHEIGDARGSHYLNRDDSSNGMDLLRRMFRVTRQTYVEYQHSHNPLTTGNQLDYSFKSGGCGFYVLDGRGGRDLSRESYRILRFEQLARYAVRIRAQRPEDTPFVFVVSAVLLVHTRAAIVASDERLGRVGDDLRDSWKHELYDVERVVLLLELFDATRRGVKASVLSRDLHVSAVIALEDDDGKCVYQLTSSAITNGLSRRQSWMLRFYAADDSTTLSGYRFRRRALFTQSAYSLISVDPNRSEAWFKLYGGQEIPPADEGENAVPINHSLAKIRLF